MTPDLRIVEVGPRDGLQNESATISTDVKVAFVNALSAAGLTEIEVSSFVSPRWVPQLADAALVFDRIERCPGVVYSALVPNERGLLRAVEARVDKIAVFTAASESFTQRNINASIAESIERFRPVVRGSPVPVRGYVSTAFHCPFEGPIPPEAVVRVSQELLELGVAELSIGDTIGKATPDEVARLLDRLLARVDPARVALHFHDTFGRAAANATAGEEFGIRMFESSTGGIGGCPYAPGASGNVATEALVQLFPGRTGVDPERLEQAAALVRPWIAPRVAGGERQGARE